MCCKKFQPFIGGEDKCYSNKTSAKEGQTFSFKLKSKESFCRIEIDGCVDNSQTSKKCDYLFVRCATNDFYFVELKGTDISGAYKQLVSSIKTIQPKIDLKKKPKDKKISLEKENIIGVISLRSVPHPQSIKLRKLKNQFREIGKELIARNVVHL
jgi:hypothetical protein